MIVELRSEGFEPYGELLRHQATLAQRGVSFGALASFVGTMRDFNDGDTVRSMRLDHYPGMTERHLERIVGAAMQRWNIFDAMVIHRIGEVLPGDPIVLVAVWTAHRGAAFDACRAIVEELKTRAPFWKKETLVQGERWVESNTSGY